MDIRIGSMTVAMAMAAAAAGAAATSCGGGAAAPATPITNNAPTPVPAGAGVVEPGDYLCRFTHDGFTYPAYECRIAPGTDGYATIVKLRGFEVFRARVEGTAPMRLTGEGGCEGDACAHKLTAELAAVDDGLWRGQVAMPGNWLDRATLELEKLPPGGDTYAGRLAEVDGYGAGGAGGE